MQIKQTNWREIVEIVALVSIVAALLLLARQVQESNHIARSDALLRLNSSWTAVHSERASNPDLAQLFVKIEAPDGHLITATDRSRMRALATHLGNLYWSVQQAHDNGLLDDASFAIYADEVERSLETWPGLREHLIAAYESMPDSEHAEIFAPVAKIVRNSGGNPTQTDTAGATPLPQD